MTLRTKETQAKYDEYLSKDHLGCFLCKTEGNSIGKYWSITKNDFPYDAVAEEHNIIYLTEHNKEPTHEELDELNEIKKLMNYDQLIENSSPSQSVPEHYHLHLIKLK